MTEQITKIEEKICRIALEAESIKAQAMAMDIMLTRLTAYMCQSAETEVLRVFVGTTEIAARRIEQLVEGIDV